MTINEIKLQIKAYEEEIYKLEEETTKKGVSIKKEIDIKNNKEIKLKKAQDFAEKWKRWSSYI